MDISFGRRLIWGGMYQYNQTWTLPIDIDNIYHPIRNCSASNLSGITFDAGSTGAVASVAAGPTGYITVTSTAHGLLNGEIVFLTNSTDYDGQFIVANKTDNTFDVLETYNVTRTCNWYQPSTLKVPVGGAGMYRLAYSMTADGAANGKNFKSELAFGSGTTVTHIDYSACERLFSTGSDYCVLTSSCFQQLAEGDYVFLQIKNTTDNTDLIVRHCNINMVVLG